jgi:hypothetical protein
MCGASVHCGPVRVTVTCLPRGGVVGPVFDGRVGNGVPAVRVAVSGYYEKLELPRRRVYAVRPRTPADKRFEHAYGYACPVPASRWARASWRREAPPPPPVTSGQPLVTRGVPRPEPHDAPAPHTRRAPAAVRQRTRDGRYRPDQAPQRQSQTPAPWAVRFGSSLSRAPDGRPISAICAQWCGA